MGLKDDIAYVGILFASIGFGKIFRMIPAENVDGIVSFSKRRYSKVFLNFFNKIEQNLQPTHQIPFIFIEIVMS